MIQNTQPNNIGLDIGTLVTIILGFLFFIGGNIIILIKKELKIHPLIKYIGMLLFAFCFVLLICIVNDWSLNNLLITIALILFFVWFILKFILHKQITALIKPQENITGMETKD